MCKACVSNIFNSGLGTRSLGRFGASATRRGFIAAAAAGTAAALACTSNAFAADNGAEVIFRGGTILPLASGPGSVGAMAIGGGRILAVGSEAEVMGLKGAGTRIVDLGGRTVLPGLIDPHHHTSFAALAAELFADLGYPKFPTRAALLAGLRAQAAATKPGEWVLGYNFDNLLQGGDFTMAELDSVSTEHPILIWYINMHDAAANSAAFKIAGVGEDVGLLPGGGHFGRGADGKLNGLIYEESAMLKFVLPALPKITPELFSRAVLDYFKTNAALGTTTLHEPGTLAPEWIAGFAQLTNQGACRASASLMVDFLKEGDAYRALGIGPRATQLPNTRFSLYGIKVIGDGSNQTLTGAQTIPYLGTQDKGATNYDIATLNKLVADVKAAGWPVLVHCNGDLALDNALDAIEAAYGAGTALGINRIEHCTMARADQVLRMKALGVQPSFLMNHVFFYGAAYRDQLFGQPRAARMDPAADCLKAGLPFTLHTDAPCSNAGQLQLVQTAVTRRCNVDGSVVGPEQAISVFEALRAVTIGAAAQIGLAERIGTLEAGKEADLTILEADPFKVAPDQIMNIKVSETWVAGSKAHG